MLIIQLSIRLLSTVFFNFAIFISSSPPLFLVLSSRPLSAVSFSIPFGLDSDVDIVMGKSVSAITRSVSSDNLNRGTKGLTRAPHTPPEDLGHMFSKSPANGSHRASWATPTPDAPLLAEENGLDDTEMEMEAEAGELPTIEEALQIIHNQGKLEPRLHPDGAPDGFYLHSPDDPASARHNGSPASSALSCSAPSRSGVHYRPHAPPPPPSSSSPSRARHTSEGSRDDDSVLRDGSVDSDASEDLPRTAHSTPATPVSKPRPSSSSGGDHTPDSGVRMTSFAERKKKKVLTPTPQEPDADPTNPASAPNVTTKKTEESPGKSPALNTEMSDLGVRLEEKRKAIEAQKKRIEAIFAKHRQQLGKSAFLQLKKGREGEGEGEAEEQTKGEVSASSTEEDLSRRSRAVQQPPEMQKHPQRHLAEEEGNMKPHAGSKENREAAQAGEKGSAPLGDYNNAVTKLNAALSSLQTDMHRLAEQQKHLMQKKPAPATSTHSWVIPPGPKTSGAPPSRLSRETTRDLPSASSSPSPSRRLVSHTTPPKSPGAHRRAQSAPPKSPKHHHASRPADLKVPVSTRSIVASQNVDSIPHLRRTAPWQCRDQSASSFSFGQTGTSMFPESSRRSTPSHLPHARAGQDDLASDAGSAEEHGLFSLELEGASTKGGSSSGAPSECSFESDVPAAGFNGKRGSLIEISLSSLRGLEDELDQSNDPFSDSMSDQTEPELKSGVGFFFKVSGPTAVAPLTASVCVSVWQCVFPFVCVFVFVCVYMVMWLYKPHPCVMWRVAAG